MKTKLLLLILVALGSFSIAARSGFSADDLLGTWKYRISDVPPEYESGSLIFEQKDNKTVGFVESGERNEIKNLAVDAGKVTFSTESEHGEFKYSLMQKGDTLTGTIASQYGDFPIMAVREAKK